MMGASSTLKRASEVKTTGGVSGRPSSAYSPKVARLNSRLVAALQGGARQRGGGERGGVGGWGNPAGARGMKQRKRCAVPKPGLEKPAAGIQKGPPRPALTERKGLK